MKDLTNKLLSAVDATALRTKRLITDLNDTISSIDWDGQMETFRKHKNTFLSRINTAWDELNQLMKQVKDTLSDYTVTVPFDEDGGEQISYNIEDGKLTVEVTYNDEGSSRCNRTTVILPSNCDASQVKADINRVNKTAKIIVPKIAEAAEPINHESQPTEERQPSQPGTSNENNELDKMIEENAKRFASIQRGGEFTRREMPTE